MELNFEILTFPPRKGTGTALPAAPRGEFCISHEMASATTLVVTKPFNLTLPDKDFSCPSPVF